MPKLQIMFKKEKGSNNEKRELRNERLMNELREK
jgi:hypothetical protein